eukprot:INCI12555.2.p2 GENE.INCI12555.2~~INCI12555.2.p2  ORF type:complete len:178 (+),score=23.86 INCI12555.2:1138-1671(+)
MIAHRDLKPANVLLKHGVGKIADFGISIRLGSTRPRHTRSGPFGTIGYQALEVIGDTGIKVDERRADCFSMGIVLHIILTGKHPFGDETQRYGRILANNATILPGQERHLASESGLHVACEASLQVLMKFSSTKDLRMCSAVRHCTHGKTGGAGTVLRVQATGVGIIAAGNTDMMVK